MNPLTLATPALTDATPLQLIDAAAAAGFAGVGMRLSRSRILEHQFYPVVGNTALIAAIKRRLADTGLSVLELYSFYIVPDFDFAAFEAAMTVGAELDAGYAVALGYDSDWARLCDTFGRMCDIAAALGLTLAVEFAPVEQCRPTTLEQALQLMHEVGRPNCAIMPDPAHLYRSGGSIQALGKIEPRYLRFCQLTDFKVTGEEFLQTLGRGVPKLQRRPVGEGSLPVFEWLDALPPGVPISVEVVPQPQGTSHADWAKALYAGSRKALDDYYASRSTSGAGR